MDDNSRMINDAIERSINQRVSDEANRKWNEGIKKYNISNEIKYIKDNNSGSEIAVGITWLVGGILIGALIASL